MPIVNVYTGEEYGGNFQFYLPESDDGCRDFSAYYFEDGSVKCKHRHRDRDVQIYPVVKEEEEEEEEEEELLVGKESKHESVSVTSTSTSTSTSGLKRRLEFTSDFECSLPDRDIGPSIVSSEIATTLNPRQIIIAHYLDHHYSYESTGYRPSLMWNMVSYPVPLYISGPDRKKKGIKDITEDIAPNPLIEVLSVDIKNNNNNQQEGCVVSLYGTICIEDGADAPEYIYNTEREDSEPISLTGDTTASLLLTGPPRAMDLYGDMFIRLALMVKKKKDTDDDDDVFYKGTLHWNFFVRVIETFDGDEWGDLTSEFIYKPPSTPFDKLLSTTFNGKSGGSVTINYVIFEQGVVANVEVTLLKHGGGGGGDHGEAAAHVYGLIKAGSNCDSFTYWSVLLQKKMKENDNEYIDVRPGQLIPLSRSLVVVNRSSSLKVSVELYDRLLRDTDLSQDDEIVKGTVDFPAQSFGMSEKNISGCYGEIRVKVSWRRW